jgi:hypothetical protein
MWIMEAVWPITALYFGPLALWGYYRWGRPQSHKWMEEHGDPPKKSFAATTAVGGEPLRGRVHSGRHHR